MDYLLENRVIEEQACDFVFQLLKNTVWALVKATQPCSMAFLFSEVPASYIHTWGTMLQISYLTTPFVHRPGVFLGSRCESMRAAAPRFRRIQGRFNYKTNTMYHRKNLACSCSSVTHRPYLVPSCLTESHRPKALPFVWGTLARITFDSTLCFKMSNRMPTTRGCFCYFL